MSADLIVLNGNVHTLDPATPWVQAVAIRNGRILAVGDTANIRSLATRATTIIE